MAKIVGMPKLSPTMEEATLSRWVKNEGEDIAIDDLIAEIETDKATMEWRSFDVGVLLKILAPEGATLKPDAPVAIFGERGDDISHLLTSTAQPSIASREDAVGEITAVAESAIPSADSVQDAVPLPGGATRVLASPSVRRLAREHTLDLNGLQGSGPRGRIIQRDIEQLLEHPVESHSIATTATSTNRAAPKVVALSATRRTIARRLTESKQTIPHYYLSLDVDAEPLRQARQELNRALEKQAEKVSLNDLLIRACANALRSVPAVNVSFMNDAIWYHQVVDISVAVAIPDGLVTPVVRDADTKGVLAIAREVRELAAQARDKKLRPEQMTGGTFTISNLGMYGIDEFAAVINPPQAAILAIGAVREEPVIRDGVLAPGRRLRLTLSCDHRVIDGAIGAEWLSVLRTMLENPIRLLL